jgi:uncharacterized membrane protein YhaH (DUF805 family)
MIMSLLTSFDGRINRAKWWLGSLIVAVAAIVLYLILAAIFGLLSIPTDPAQIASMMRTGAIVQLLLVIIIAYPTTALMIKRLNDRDRPRYFAYIFWAPSILSLVGGVLGITQTTVDMGGIPMPTPNGLGYVLLVASFVVGIWALIELGILKGTEGPNQHGPDPLGAV